MNKLRFKVGSANKAKVDAVSETLKDYLHLAEAEVAGMKTASGVSDQPLSLDETITGATNRARNAFVDCEYSVGIESGLMAVAQAKSRYLDVCVAVIHDGVNFHLGISSAWEFKDTSVIASMIKEGLDMSQAIQKAKMTSNENIGSEEGAIGIVTKGRIDRKAYTKQALQMALIHLEPAE